MKSIMDEKELSEASESAVELRKLNAAIWDLENAIRLREQRGLFDEGFVELARRIYRTNDRRAAVKRRISLQSGSRLLEVKEYPDYGET